METTFSSFYTTVFNWFVHYLIKLHNYNSKSYWHKQVWELSQLPPGKQRVEADMTQGTVWTVVCLSHMLLQLWVSVRMADNG
jgi:hypothetical protein